MHDREETRYKSFLMVRLPGRIEFLFVLQYLSRRSPHVGFQMVFEDLPMDRIHRAIVGPRHDYGWEPRVLNI